MFVGQGSTKVMNERVLQICVQTFVLVKLNECIYVDVCLPCAFVFRTRDSREAAGRIVRIGRRQAKKWRRGRICGENDGASGGAAGEGEGTNDLQFFEHATTFCVSLREARPHALYWR